MTSPKNIALILAGGEGTRAQQPVPKQYVQIEGIPLLAYTLRTFDRHPLIDAIYVVCRDKWRAYVEQFTMELGFMKFCGTFPAGDSSIDSVRNGILGLQRLPTPSSWFTTACARWCRPRSSATASASAACGATPSPPCRARKPTWQATARKPPR